MPSEHNVADRQAHAVRFKTHFSIGGSLHCGNQSGARTRLGRRVIGNRGRTPENCVKRQASKHVGGDTLCLSRSNELGFFLGFKPQNDSHGSALLILLCSRSLLHAVQSGCGTSLPACHSERQSDRRRGLASESRLVFTNVWLLFKLSHSNLAVQWRSGAALWKNWLFGPR